MDIILKYFDDFSKTQLKQFSRLESLYRDWNSKINVISRKDIGSLYEKHVLHSLSIAAAFEFQPGTEIIDIGTGGGFPGIPLAIFFPDVKFHLVDSIAKKISVVNFIAKEIGLNNITIAHTRVEEIKNKKFDLAISRAVAPLKDLWRWSKPILKKPSAGNPNSANKLSGLICLKGGNLNQEIQESGVRPRVLEITDIFNEDYFKEKFILFISL